MTQKKCNGHCKKEYDTVGRHCENGGRPGADINEEDVYKLARLWCTVEEIAAHFDVHPETIQRRFAVIINRGKEVGKASLRRMQWRAASDGNVTMQIWLGKQILKQHEPKEEIEISEKDAQDIFKDKIDFLHDISKIIG